MKNRRSVTTPNCDGSTEPPVIREFRRRVREYAEMRQRLARLRSGLAAESLAMQRSLRRLDAHARSAAVRTFGTGMARG